MTIFFCAETGGFYPDEPYGDALGKKCVELSLDVYQDLRDAIDQGKEITVINGVPEAVDRIVPPEQLIDFERNWRDSEIRNTEWLVTRHRDEQDLQLALSLTTEQFAELLRFRQSLRDWPQSEHFPDSQSRPVAPPWIAEQTQ